MYKNSIILTKLDIRRSPSVDVNNPKMHELFTRDKEAFYKASFVIYINEVGDIKVLKDRTGELTHEIIDIALKRHRQLESPYFTGNQNVEYTLTRKGKKVK